MEPWVFREVGHAEWGDARLTLREMQSVDALSQHPEGSLPDAFQGDAAGLKASYRFFDNDRVDPAALLPPHQEATRDRCLQGLIVHSALAMMREGVPLGIVAQKELALTPVSSDAGTKSLSTQRGFGQLRGTSAGRVDPMGCTRGNCREKRHAGRRSEDSFHGSCNADSHGSPCTQSRFRRHTIHMADL